MFKFNSNDIFTGEIKQLLTSFNLPKYRIYTGDDAHLIPSIERDPGDCKLDAKEKPHLHSEILYSDHVNYADYIKDNRIQRCFVEKEQRDPITGEIVKTTYIWKDLHKTYSRGEYIANRTKNLIIKNSIYDSYTHEYLGDYLRFKRDFDNVDLMSMYNCFSNRICNNLKISDSYKTITDKDTGKCTALTFTFNTNDNAYKIYMVPVKLFQKYTIAIDCTFGIELCCGLFDSYQDKRDKVAQLPRMTYQKLNKTNFNQPFLYTKLYDLSPAEITEMELAQDEEALKLFIKVPASVETSIVILEGDYRGYNDVQLSLKAIHEDGEFTGMHASLISNSTIINLENLDDYETFKPRSPLQLLRMNTKVSYPFANRLMEYLVGNAIDDDEMLPDNVKRVQTVLAENGINDVNSTTHPWRLPGIWSKKMQLALYEYMQNIGNDFLTNTDQLGYVDKDVEKIYHSTKNGKKLHSISGINIYADIYPVTRGGTEDE